MKSKTNLKKTVLIMAITLSSGCIINQGALQAQNLQFKSVKLTGTTEDTVKAGEVWKIESVMPQNSFKYIQTNNTTVPKLTSAEDFIIIVNGSNVYLGAAGAGVTCGLTTASGAQSVMYSSVNSDLFPIWLPASTTLKASTNILYISVLVFDVVP